MRTWKSEVSWLEALFLLCAAFLACAITVTPAHAERPAEGTIGPFLGLPSSGAFDAAGNLWITDQNAEHGLYEFGPFPTHTNLAEPTPAWGGSPDLQVAVDHSTGKVLVTQSNGRLVAIYDSNGNELETWTSIHGTSSGSIKAAIDNSNTPTRGKLYLSLASENQVEAYDVDRLPAEFPASADYISDNAITGTPSGHFGSVRDVAVDGAGNLYVSDIVAEKTYEFDSTGTFVRSFPTSGQIALDPTNGNVFIGPNEYDEFGNLLDTLDIQRPLAVSAAGRLYALAGFVGTVTVFGPAPTLPAITNVGVTGESSSGGTVEARIDPTGGGAVTSCKVEYGPTVSYALGAVPCIPDPEASPPGSQFSTPTDVSAALAGLTAETGYHYRVVVTNASGTRYSADQIYTPHKVVGLRTDSATGVSDVSATLNASLLGDGTSTQYYFEWGTTESYGHVSATPPGMGVGSPSGPSRTPLPLVITDLSPYTTYHYRVVATSLNGTSTGADRTFTTSPGQPIVGDLFSSDVHADRAVIHASINPNGSPTTFHFEYVDDANYQQSGFATAKRFPAQDLSVGRGKHAETQSALLAQVSAGTLYHYRAVASNDMGVVGEGATFTTYAVEPGINDPCPNAQARQQTGSALLLECRAYELVSAPDAGGYDVESDTVAGQAPFGGYPLAESPTRVLYGVHQGAIGLDGEYPANHGLDPYVATRTAKGWSTTYAGIPSNNPFATAPFGSGLDEASETLSTFAFGGDICSPCFADGSAGIPVRAPNGQLVQGMAGSTPQPGASPGGFVRKQFSDDGRYFVFGSTSSFEPGVTEGELAIYLRDLEETPAKAEVISKTPGGSNIACLLHCTTDGIGALDISSDGSRTVVGQLLNVDGAGNRLWHLYMHLRGSDHTVDLTPSAVDGVVYDGMTSDGASVYYSTTDQMTTAADQDTDASSDVYRADVDGAAATITRVSIGSSGTGDADLCDPAPDSVNLHWNTVDGVADCGAVAVSGGVAREGGGIYFLSPEKLVGSGPQGEPTQNAPNLYLATPGQATQFVATLESKQTGPAPLATAHTLEKSVGGLENPESVAVDQATGSVYVANVVAGVGNGYIKKFDSEGNPSNFSSSASPTIGGFTFVASRAQVAVDNSNGPTAGDIYVTNNQGISKVVRVYDRAGNLIQTLTGSATPQGAFGTGTGSTAMPTGVAVSTDGTLYVGGGNTGKVYRYVPAGAVVAEADYAGILNFGASSQLPTRLAVDSLGRLYAHEGGLESLRLYPASQWGGTTTAAFSTIEAASRAVAVDPLDDYLYVAHAKGVAEYLPGAAPHDSFGGGQVENGKGVAVHGSADGTETTVYVADATGQELRIFTTSLSADPTVDNDLVIRAVNHPGAPANGGGLQQTPEGRYAAFVSSLPLTGYANNRHGEVYRYDSQLEEMACTSCNPTGQTATADATIATQGLSIADDGRVFFNSREGLVDRDLNNKLDAYEWKPAGGGSEERTELISAGTSPFDSSLLSVSASGSDAYFFTRDTLASNDRNGTRVKIYDARSGGGFSIFPPPEPCKASDECHGPGSVSPPPPNIKSIAGTPEASTSPSKCKKGFVRKRGRCVKRSKSRHHRSAAKTGGRRGHLKGGSK
jgi:hypothetical protein